VNRETRISAALNVRDQFPGVGDEGAGEERLGAGRRDASAGEVE
jgi:hypothetical protein